MTATPQIERPQRSPGLSPGNIIVGVLLLLLGVGWLMLLTTDIPIAWDVALAVVLMVLGAALVAGSRNKELGWLIGPGIVISVILAFTTSFPAPVIGPVGDRILRPVSVAEASAPYRLAFGTMTIDLRDLTTESEETRITGSVGAGELIVVVPEGAAVTLNSHVGAGSVTFMGEKQDGVGLNRTFIDDNQRATRTLFLDLSVGAGEIEVRR
jgi:hypothetical protein